MSKKNPARKTYVSPYKTENEPKKNGRPMMIKEPDEILSLFEQYKAYCKANPFRVRDWVGATATQVTREKERPLTLEGFEVFCFKQGLTISNYFENRNGEYDKFYAICSYIRREIRDEQIGGGMAGIYNPSITQRLNGLVEKQQNDNQGEMTIKVKYERDNDNASETP